MKGIGESQKTLAKGLVDKGGPGIIALVLIVTVIWGTVALLFIQLYQLFTSDEAKDWLVEHGFDPQFGARPLRRVIQDNVEDRLSDAILGSQLNPGDTAVIEVVDDEIAVKANSPFPVASA